MSKASKSVLGFFAIAVAAPLLPFAIIGKNWGMVWMEMAFPFSNIAEENIGIGKDSYFLIAIVSLCCASLWTAVAYWPLKRIFGK